MPDKILLFTIGLIVGVATFTAIGATTSVLMSQVQEHVAPQAQPPLTSYAQYQRINEPIAR